MLGAGASNVDSPSLNFEPRHIPTECLNLKTALSPVESDALLPLV